MMEIYQIKDFKAVIINTVEYGSMCEEFDPGPSEDDPFPEYYNCSVEATLIDTRNNIISDLTYKGMKELYKKVEGKSLRISYWRDMKYIKYCEEGRKETERMEKERI